MEGVIYKYTSPSGRVYIGQTINEERRRKDFRCNSCYSGEKIDKARRKYGPENFEYKVICRVICDNKTDLLRNLDRLEKVYIYAYDSVRNGYNITDGGHDYTRTDEMKNNIREKCKGHPAWNSGFKGCFSKNTIKMMSDAKKGKEPWNKGKRNCQVPVNKKKVCMYDLDDNLIKVFDSISDAAKYVGAFASAISNCCIGRFKTSKGYKWKFKEDV